MSSDPTYFRRIVFESPDCVKILDGDARLVSMNENGRKALCISNFMDVAGADWRLFWEGDSRVDAAAAIDVAQHGGIGHFVGRYDVAGVERWWDVTVSAMPGGDGYGRMLAISRDITALRSLQARESRQQAHVEKRLRAINAASRLLSSSLDFEVTLSAIGDIAVDAFASFCAIGVADGFERRHVIVRQRRGTTQARLEPLRTALLDSQEDRGWPNPDHSTPAVEAALRDLNVVATLVVPIEHDGLQSGTLALFVDEPDLRSASGPLFDSVDRLFAEELGRRAGAALANARSYGRERAIAVRMQESALPDVPSNIGGVHLSAAYRLSSSEATIGGDWFDAFELPGGRVALTIGDVGGHGLTAALTMTKIRQAMRATALLSGSVLSMLSIADRTLRMDNADVYATAMCAIYDPHTHRLEFASAGHPGPLVRNPDGTIEELRAPAPLLGIGHAFKSVRTIEVAPNTLFVFFTDGLVEMERNLDLGFASLEAVLAKLPAEADSDFAQKLIDAVLGSRATPDDAAVLTAYFTT